MSARRVFAAGLGVAALGWAATDYRRWRALGPGGVPGNPLGWLVVTWLRLRKRDPLDTGGYPGPRAVGAQLSGPLPARRGTRPRIAPYPVPHRQLDQIPDREFRANIAALLESTVAERDDVLTFRRSRLEKHNQAIFLRDAPEWAIPGDGEIAHLHPVDGSMHVTLSPADAAACVSAGWGEWHPLAGVLHRLPDTYLLVYPPRDSYEMAIAARILHAAVDHALAQSGR